MISRFDKVAIATLGLLLSALLLVAITHAIDWARNSPIESEMQSAADRVCADLLLMHQQGSNNAVGALGIVRCAILEATREGS